MLHLVVRSLQTHPSLMSLTVLKNKGLNFYSDPQPRSIQCSFITSSSHAFQAGMPQKWCHTFISGTWGGSAMTTHPSPTDVDPDHLLLVVSVSFLHLQVTFLLFLLILILWEWLLPVSATSMMVTKWWFSISAIFLTCTSWHPAVRNSFSFLPFVYSFILFT